MSMNATSTRRRFFGHAGAALAVPLAATPALAQSATPPEAVTRLATLEAVNAIRALQREYARRLNAGAPASAAHLFADPASAPVDASLRRLAADRFATDEVIELAPDGATAAACFDCTVETEVVIAGRYTLVDMLREQGDAALRSMERRVLESAYVRQGGAWKIASLVLRRV